MTDSSGRYLFKRAETEWELEQVHRLNYRTFVREIPQHSDPGSGRLIDKFHDKNHYFIALSGEQVIGMVSVHDRPPFSVNQRLSDPGILERPGMRPLEVRLLAIDRSARCGKTFAGLLWQVQAHARSAGNTHLIISAVAGREGLYRRMGFSRLGPPVPCGSAEFVPMIVEIEKMPLNIRRDIDRWTRYLSSSSDGDDPEPLSLNPGPVKIAREVRMAFGLPSISHRSPEFRGLFRGVRDRLAALVGGREVALLLGNGTLANDAVAAVLAARREPGRGLVLSGGEFGDRLAVHAARAGLEFRTIRSPWGKCWELDRISTALDAAPATGWIWGVHLESSTGVLNDLGALVAIARERGVRVVMDCVSSLGAVPLDLSGVELATGVSGKSLGSYAGVAIAFAAPGALAGLDPARVPPCLDLKAALETDGPRFTFPSPILQALEAALRAYATPPQAEAVFERYRSLGCRAREGLRRLGLTPLAEDRWASPVITTFHPPGQTTSEEFVEECRALGFDIGGLSRYLRERRLVQVATMGDISEEDLLGFFEKLSEQPAPAPVSGNFRLPTSALPVCYRRLS